MAEGKTTAADKSRCYRHDGRKVYCKVAWSISSIPSSDNRVEWHEKTLLWWRNTYSPLAKECLLHSYGHHELGVVGAGRQPSMQCQEWTSDGTSFQEVANQDGVRALAAHCRLYPSHLQHSDLLGVMVWCAYATNTMVGYLNPQDFLSWRVKKGNNRHSTWSFQVHCITYPVSSRIRTTINSSA